jgi:hypothetical protein
MLLHIQVIQFKKYRMGKEYNHEEPTKKGGAIGISESFAYYVGILLG